MLVLHRVTPNTKFPGTHLYTWAERGTLRVKCLAKDHNKMFPARARTRTAWSGDERFHHEATESPQYTYESLFITKHRNSRPGINSWPYCNLLSNVVGLPTLVVAVSLAATDGKGYADPQSCWLSTRNHILWAFVVPALLIVTVSSGCYFIYPCSSVPEQPWCDHKGQFPLQTPWLRGPSFFQQGNIVVFALVIYSMLSSHRLRKEPLSRRFQRGLKASFVLLPLLGISWSFGVLTMTSDKIVFNYIFAIFNSLQGFFIFIFHCVFNKQVRFRCICTQKTLNKSLLKYCLVILLLTWSCWMREIHICFYRQITCFVILLWKQLLHWNLIRAV